MTDKPDIVAVIESEGIELKRGGRRLWGLCPLHSEKTASFCVDPERQRFRCFGCARGGDVITFIMELKGLSFSDSLRHLGIADGKPPAVDSTVIKKRELIRVFKRWGRGYHNYLADEFRTLNQMKNYIKTEADLDLYAPIFWEISDIECQLDVIEHGGDESKFQLFCEVSSGI